MKTIAIGDIHGYPVALNTLLAQLNPRDDRLVFLGDYIDRGPGVRQVLDTLIRLSANPNHVFLRGNHDDWLLHARTDKWWFNSWITEGVGGRETLRSYGATRFDQESLALIPARHFDFLERTQLYFQTEHEIFVHASLGRQEPEHTESRKLMWDLFEEITPHPSGKRVICGHTSQKSGLPCNNGYAVCIDTFCSGTSWLSAFDVDSDEVIQANNQGEVRQFVLGE